MNFLRRMLSPVTPSTKLGRWNLHYDPKIVNSKVDQANEDHCGCCHVPTQEKQAMQQMQKRKWQERQQCNYMQKKLSESDEYYIPYFM